MLSRGELIVVGVNPLEDIANVRRLQLLDIGGDVMR
jgi:hypothetical protein